MRHLCQGVMPWHHSHRVSRTAAIATSLTPIYMRSHHKTGPVTTNYHLNDKSTDLWGTFSLINHKSLYQTVTVTFWSLPFATWVWNNTPFVPYLQTDML